MPGQQNSANGGGYDPNVDPGNVNPPAIFEPATALTGSAVQLWIAASGGANWGGAVVSVSFDGANYSNIGMITAPAYQGVLTVALANHADPDTTDTLAIDLSESAGILPTSATHADADAFRTLVWITAPFVATAPSTGELLSYGAVAATGTYTSNLSYLRRGLYGTAPAAHAGGSFFTRIDLGARDAPPNSVLTWDLPPQYIGAAVHVKLQSFNVFGNALQDIAGVAAYSYTPTGAGYGGGAGGVPTMPANFSGRAQGPSGGGWNFLQWSANPESDHVQYYQVLRRIHGIGTYTPADTATGTNYTDNGATSGIVYDYEIEAVNAAGAGSPAGPVTVTTN